MKTPYALTMWFILRSLDDSASDFASRAKLVSAIRLKCQNE